MSDAPLEIWLHTRGETWDYRWIAGSTTTLTEPRKGAMILKQVAPSEPNEQGAILVWHDESRLSIATGSYSDRKDRYRRRIHQCALVSQQSTAAPVASKVMRMVAALSQINITPVVSMLATYEFGVSDFCEKISSLVRNANLDAYPSPTIDAITSENLQWLIETQSLLCVDAALSFSEVCSSLHRGDEAIRTQFYYGSGIHDPLMLSGSAGIISTSKPLLQFGATAGQCVIFTSDGNRSLHQYADLPRRPVKPAPSTDVQAFVKTHRPRWKFLSARGSFGIK